MALGVHSLPHADCFVQSSSGGGLGTCQRYSIMLPLQAQQQVKLTQRLLARHRADLEKAQVKGRAARFAQREAP